MSSFNLNINNILTFKRLSSFDVLSYIINVEETLPSGEISKYVLDTIINPINPCPVKHILDITINNKSEYDLPKDTYCNPECPVVLILNDIPLNTVYYSYSDQTKILRITANYINLIQPSDKLCISYYKDEIQFTHATINKCKYYIKPVIKYSHNTGDHNILL